MSKRILFTRSVDQQWINDQLGGQHTVHTQPALSFNYTPQNEILARLPITEECFIVTSQNTAKAIEGLPMKGQFFVVGQKTAKVLQEQGRTIAQVTDYARDLAPLLISYPPQTWFFLCGSSRRDLLVDQLKLNQHQVVEIITYHSIANELKQEEIYDFYAFFSPLSFQSFLIHNQLGERAIIFSIGDTTTEEIKKHYPKNCIFTAKTPLLEEVVNDIKKYLHAKE